VLIDLADATPKTSGGKATPLAHLLSAGLPVPPGFVVPTHAYEEAIARVDAAGAARHDADAARLLVEQATLTPGLVGEISTALTRVTDASSDGCVAVRSSATSEDGADAAAAGQHDTFLGVRGPDQVADAVRRCWASLWSKRAVAYRQRQPGDVSADPPLMAVLVQRLVDADVAGVLFTGTTVRIEATWGLGESIVGGQVTPDSWAVTDGAIVHRAVGHKDTRMDRVRTQVVTHEVPPTDRDLLCLNDDVVVRLARLGRRIENLLGRPQDLEWAIADNQIWILQARPITASLPTGRTPQTGLAATGIFFAGTPGSPGLAAGPARVVRGPSDFARVEPGDVLVCRTTDPAWTPLFGVVAAVVTETGGLLSHAAIVAREQGLPAVLAVPDATTALPDGATVEVDGSNGHVVLAESQPEHG